ncbi:MAG: carbohydrate ABC transporter permease [Burkholderiales bacterium]|nr:carbohydrate ABC transporter permease [Burkholderiales bacterium]
MNHAIPARRKLVGANSTYAVIVNSLLIGIAFLSMAPLLWMVSVSLMSPGESGNFPPPILPENASLYNYKVLFTRGGMGGFFINSFLLAALTTTISLMFNVSAGYAFAKLHFAGRERIFKLLLSALVIPGQVAMLPLFLLLKNMGLVNTYAGVVIPGMAGIFGIFLVRQYARTIPDDLLEAARMDGAGELLIFVRIVLPILKPVLATLAIFTFLGSWNDFMWPLIVLTDSALHTLPVALSALSREHVQDSELMMAGAVVTILPVLLLFLVLQRFYISGLMMGAVK